MSFVIAAPEFLTAAAGQTTGVLAAGADEVSAAVAALFAQHAQAYQALSVQAAAFHAHFVQALTAGAGSYASTEAASASPLQAFGQDVLAVVNAPTEALLDRPLIGNGANGGPGAGRRAWWVVVRQWWRGWEWLARSGGRERW